MFLCLLEAEARVLATLLQVTQDEVEVGVSPRQYLTVFPLEFALSSLGPRCQSRYAPPWVACPGAPVQAETMVHWLFL